MRASRSSKASAPLFTTLQARAYFPKRDMQGYAHSHGGIADFNLCYLRPIAMWHGYYKLNYLLYEPSRHRLDHRASTTLTIFTA